MLPTLEQSRKMVYMNMVIKETLRMVPALAALFPRVTTKDTELGGVSIPKGTNVLLEVYELQHNPTVWENPDTFDPERWVPGGEADRLNSRGIAWAPFSNGTRQCIGMNFSMDEQRVILPMLLRKYKFSLPPDTIHKDKLVTITSSTIKPTKMYFNLTRRY